MKIGTFDWIAWVLVIIGGINWGLVGLFDFNLVVTLFGVDNLIADIIYILIGLAAIYLLIVLPGRKIRENI